MNFLKNSYFIMPPKKGELDASVAMALNLQRCGMLAPFTCFFNKLNKILYADELLNFPPRMIRSILHTRMRRARSAVGLLRWSGGDCSATPPTLRLLVACGLCGSRPLRLWKRYSASEGPRSGRGFGHLGTLSPLVHGPCFLDPSLLASIRSRTKLTAWPISPYISKHLEELCFAS